MTPNVTAAIDKSIYKGLRPNRPERWPISRTTITSNEGDTATDSSRHNSLVTYTGTAAGLVRAAKPVETALITSDCVINKT